MHRISDVLYRQAGLSVIYDIVYLHESLTGRVSAQAYLIGEDKVNLAGILKY